MLPAPRKDIEIIIIIRNLYWRLFGCSFSSIWYRNRLAGSRQSLLVDGDDRL